MRREREVLLIDLSSPHSDIATTTDAMEDGEEDTFEDGRSVEKTTKEKESISADSRFHLIWLGDISGRGQQTTTVRSNDAGSQHWVRR